MNYIPLTKEEEEYIFKEIGVKDFDSLISIIPENIRCFDDLKIGKPLSELDVKLELEHISNLNKHNYINFLGAGTYDHFVPSVVDFIANRSEFYTAYTPYQAEVSQGTLQYLYEFQSMICKLSGMDISTASL